MIEFGVLGPLTVRQGAREVDLGTPMMRRILAVLLCQPGRMVSAESLIDSIWEGDEPPTARKTLQGYVMRLRRVLGQERIRHTSAGYALVINPGELDAEVFAGFVARARAADRQGDLELAAGSYRQGLGLWRGKAYADVHFGPEIATAAQALDDQHLAVIEEKLHLELRRGAHAQVAADLPGLISLHPYREPLREYLMLALVQSGRRAEALDVYRAAWDQFTGDLGVEPGPDLQRLHQEILQGSEIQVLPAGAMEQAAAKVTQRRFLPWDVPDFTGRTAELRRLDELASQRQGAGAVLITAIAGTGGVGKTALAVHWALRAADQFPDGQLYINLRGYSSASPLTAGEALGQLIRSLGIPPETVPNGEEEAAALYRASLVDRRVLILLDNARSADQVRPLLPGGAGNLVVVTSRDRLSGLIARDGAQRLTLGTLTDSESLVLLSRIIGHDRVDAERAQALELVRACGSLPLALRLAAAQLADEPGQSLHDFTKALLSSDRTGALEVEGDPSGALEAIFEMSVSKLDDEALILFRRLGLLPVSEARSWVAAALTGSSIAAAEGILRRLGEASLLTIRQDGYQMHDLVHHYARKLTDADDVAGLRNGYETLLNLALQADAASPSRHYPTPGEPDDAKTAYLQQDSSESSMEWFAAEHDLLLRAAVDAAERGWRELAWQSVTSMTNFAGVAQYADEWTRAADLLLMGSDDDDYGTAPLLLGLGGILRSRGGTPLQARPLLSRARRLFRRHGDIHRAATAATQLSMVYRAMGKPRAARAAARWAISRLEEGPMVSQLGWAYLAQGNLLAAVDAEFAETRAAYERALAVMQATAERAGEGNVLVRYGQLLQHHASPDEALAMYQRATEVLGEVEDHVGLCMVNIAMARLHLASADLDAARANAEDALQTAQNSHHNEGTQTALGLSAEIALQRGDFDLARERLIAAVAMIRTTGMLLPLAQMLFQLSHAHAALGDSSSAIATAEEAVELYTSLGRPEKDDVIEWLAARRAGSIVGAAGRRCEPGR